jgi:hypothetical protein
MAEINRILKAGAIFLSGGNAVARFTTDGLSLIQGDDPVVRNTVLGASVIHGDDPTKFISQAGVAAVQGDNPLMLVSQTAGVIIWGTTEPPTTLVVTSVFQVRVVPETSATVQPTGEEPPEPGEPGGGDAVCVPFDTGFGVPTATFTKESPPTATIRFQLR